MSNVGELQEAGEPELWHAHGRHFPTPSGLSSLMAESENTTGTTIGRRAMPTYVVTGRSWVVRAHFPSDLVLLSAREACGTVRSSKA
jgi:hypothetical protein